MQFKSFMSVIKDMIRKVETDHSVHLQQLGQMKEQTQYNRPRNLQCIDFLTFVFLKGQPSNLHRKFQKQKRPTT